MTRRRRASPPAYVQRSLFDDVEQSAPSEPAVEREVVFIVWSEERDSVVFAAAKRLVGRIAGVRLSVHPFVSADDARGIIERPPCAAERRVLLLIDFERRQYAKVAELAKLRELRYAFGVVVFSREEDWAEKARGLKRVIDRVTCTIVSVRKASGERAFFAARDTLVALARVGLS